MLVRLPERIRPLHCVGFALTLAFVELAQGSDPLCVFYVFGYILAAAFAFNKMGGLTWPSGGFIFFYSMLTMIVGVVWKAVLGEPVDSNLRDPQATFAAYMVGMIALGVTGIIVSYFRPRKPFITGYVPPEEAEHAAMGCFLAGVGLILLVLMLPSSGLTSFLIQVNRLPDLTLLIAVYYRVRNTEGRSASSGVAILTFTLMFLGSLITFSKQAIFTPFVCWILGALALGYWISLKRFVVVCLAMVAIFSVMSPYAQYGRDHREEFSNPLDVIVQLVMHPTEIAEKQREHEENEKGLRYHYYNENEGGMERLTMLTLDDPLIEISDHGKTMGLDWSWIYVLNSIPRFLLPDKPSTASGNMYAHEIGLLSKEDTTTGVSFSSIAEAYHISRWLGLLIVLPIFAFIGMWMSDAVTGSVKDGPWALLYTLIWAHAGPEAGLGGLLYVAAQGTVAVALLTVFVSRIGPAIGTLVLGPAKRRDTQTERAVAQIPQRVRGGSRQRVRELF